MDEDRANAPPRRPRLTERAAADQAARRAREAEALRANLRRRKDQARAREAGDTAPAADAASGQTKVPR